MNQCTCKLVNFPTLFLKFLEILALALIIWFIRLMRRFTMEKSDDVGLVRNLSLFDIVMMGIAAMIGGAIFVLVGPGLEQAGPALIIAFLINGLITMFTAFTYAELGSTIPEAGGGFKWIREGLPRPNAFLSGWISWFGHMIAGSLYAIAFGSFMSSMINSSNIFGSQIQYLDKLFAVVAIAGLVYANIRGVSEMGKTGNVITLSQIVIIGLLISGALFAMIFTNPNWQTNFENFFPNGSSGLIIAMALTFIAFEGYEIIVQTGEEVKNPKRNIPKAIFISLSFVVAIYVIFTFAFVGGLDPSILGQESWEFIGGFGELGILKASEYLIPFGAIIVLTGGIVSTLSALNATTFSSSRVSYAMAKQHDLPERFNQIDKNYHTPKFAIVISGVIMTIVAVSLPLEQIALAAGVMFLFLFSQVNVSVIRIRRNFGEKLDYGFKTPFFPIVPIAGILTSIGLAFYLLFFNPLSWIIAVVWIIIGFMIYKGYSQKHEISYIAPLLFQSKQKIKTASRILVVYDKEHFEKLYKLSVLLAPNQNTEILFLDIVDVPVQIPLSYSEEFLKKTRDSQNDIKNIKDNTNMIRHIGRISHDRTEAILATLEEEGANTLLVNFDLIKNNRKLYSLSTCDIIGVRFGKDFDPTSQIVVSYDKGRHSDYGIEVANLIKSKTNSKLRIVRCLYDSPEKEQQILGKINEKLFDLGLSQIPIERLFSLGTPEESLISNFGTDELVILGSGNQSEQTYSPVTLKILNIISNTVLIVKDSRISHATTKNFYFTMVNLLERNLILYKIYLFAYLNIRKFVKTKHRNYEDDYYFAKPNGS